MVWNVQIYKLIILHFCNSILTLKNCFKSIASLFVFYIISENRKINHNHTFFDKIFYFNDVYYYKVFYERFLKATKMKYTIKDVCKIKLLPVDDRIYLGIVFKKDK